MTHVLPFQFLELLVKSSSVGLIFSKSTYFNSKLKTGCGTKCEKCFACMSLVVCLHLLVLENMYTHSKLVNVFKHIHSKIEVEGEFLWWFDDSTSLVSWCSSAHWPKGELFGGQLEGKVWWAPAPLVGKMWAAPTCQSLCIWWVTRRTPGTLLFSARLWRGIICFENVSGGVFMHKTVQLFD